MKNRSKLRVLVLILLSSLLFSPYLALAPAAAARIITVSFATFNISDLSTEAVESGTDFPAKMVAEIIQRVSPDVLSINEIAYDVPGVRGSRTMGENARKFVENYLMIPQKPGLPSLDYPYVFFEEGNTGVPSGKDLDNDGRTDGPGDAYGFGNYEGQFSIALLSRFPIVTTQVRTFRNFLWKDMPNNMIPPNYYSGDELAIFRLSSKSHWDISINIGGTVIHVIMAHPTPPVFDGPEDRNGRRNHDEIRLIADYLSGADYVYDDKGLRAGLPPGSGFVIMGDMNADPLDGDSTANAIDQLLKHPLISTAMLPTSEGGPEVANPGHRNPPQYDTADFSDPNPGNLQADYVLPSKSLKVVDAKVFWPKKNDPVFAVVDAASDHRSVWISIQVEAVTNIPPTSAISYSPTSPKISDEIKFADKSVDKDGEIISFQWEFGDGTSSNERNPTHKYMSRGIFKVKLTVRDNDGAAGTTGTRVKIVGLPPTAKFAYSPVSPTEGQEVSFNDLSTDAEGTIKSWQWDFGDGATSTDRNPKHTFTKSGTFTVTLIAKDDEDLSSKKEEVLNVSSPPRKPIWTEPLFQALIIAVILIAAVTVVRRIRKKQ